MDVILKNNYKANIETDTDKKFIHLDFERCNFGDIVTYQLEMLSNNPCTNIAPIEMRIEDDSVQLYYNISNCISLKEFLSAGITGISDFKRILEDISGVLLKSRNLFLYENGFELDENHIFVNTSDKRILMLYVPVKNTADYKVAFRDLVIQIVTVVKLSDQDYNSSMLNSIIKCIKSPEYSLSGLNQYLSGTKPEYNSIIDPCYEPHPAGEQNQHYMQEKADNKRRNPDGKTTLSMEAGRQSRSSWYSGKTKLIVLFQALIFLTASLVEYVMNTAGIEADTRYIAIGMVAVIGNLLLIKVMSFKKVQAPKKSNHPQTNKAVKPDNKNITNNNFHKSDEFIISKLKPEQYNENNQTVKPVKKIEETVLLGKDAVSSACLIGNNGDNPDIAEIKDTNFIIGRNPALADMVIHEKSVGRIHAEIISKEKEYFLVDRNSKNGTYLNEERLVAGREYKLKNSDILVFANKEYKFVI
ncbi:MAG: DUF6382 domain-containing protein [Bacillota bacterium]|nr:DUF6382 domain-containing protein [Bacillota bacterium]